MLGVPGTQVKPSVYGCPAGTFGNCCLSDVSFFFRHSKSSHLRIWIGGDRDLTVGIRIGRGGRGTRLRKGYPCLLRHDVQNRSGEKERFAFDGGGVAGCMVALTLSDCV